MTIVDPPRNASSIGAPGSETDLGEQVFAAARRVLERGPIPDGGERTEAFEQAVDEAIHQANRTLLAAGRTPIAAGDQARLRQSTAARLAGLGGLAVLLADASIEDIVCNGCDNVWIQRSDGTREQAAPVADSDAELIAAVQVLAAGAGLSDTERRFDRAAPALNLQLPDGSRLHAIRDVAHRPSVSIRRHRLAEAELGQLERGGMFSPEIAALLRAAVAADCNMIVAGPMGSGKTTLLRALAGLLPPDERIVTIEDNYELGLHTDARHGNVVALQVREPNIEGAGGISAGELFRESLRMRPDRVIVGEARGPEVAVMLDAMSNGADGSLSTIHTSSSAGVFTKMKTYARKPPAGYEPEVTAELIGGSLDLVIQLTQVRERRWVSSIREVCGSEGAMVVSNELYTPTGPEKTAQQATPLSAARAERLAEHGWRPPTMQGRW